MRHLRTRAGVCIALALALATAAGASPDEDRFLAGYAQAVLERDLGLRVVSLAVEDGVARVVVETLGDRPAAGVAEALVRIEGIERVEVSEAGDAQAEAEATTREPDPFELLPRVEIFAPLLADPREPHFSIAYLRYVADPELENVASANFGETFALLGGDVGGGRWELGLLGGVFSIFDFDAESFDLINSDFWGGITLSGRRRWLSGQLRLYHQSSHLGDEFLLRNRATRVNLSYEGANLLVSADVRPWLRTYVGGGAIFHSTPDLDPLSVQAGVELRSPIAFLGGVVRPIAAFDYQGREENHWHEEIAGAGGVMIENPRVSRLRLRVTADYFHGASPNGQFYRRRIRYIGVGAHLHF